MNSSPNDLLIHATSHGEIGGSSRAGFEFVFRGCRWAGDQFAGFGMLNEEIEEELGRFLHNRVGPIFEKFLVAGESVVFPKVLAAPSDPHRPHAITGFANHATEEPGVGGVVCDDPSAAIGLLGRDARPGPEGLDQIEEGLVAFGEVADLGRPVVHLGVDVQVVVAVPGRDKPVGPDPL